MTEDERVITASASLGSSGWSLIVHGGAGDVALERRPLHVAGCERAALSAAAILARGGSALDAVQRAVEILEDDPVFNAGTGACLNADATVELDAAIMDGTELRGGGVCALPPFKNPVAIARRLLDERGHVLLAGEGAARFAIERGFERVDAASMITEFARERWDAVRAKRASAPWAGGTVGAVARDARGAVAAATSTGGTVNKLPGRVGDSPILGAGTYADDRTGACSTTGHGEAMMRVLLAKSILDRLANRAGEPTIASEDGHAERAARAALAMMHERTGEKGGAIIAFRDGSLGLARTTATMSWAAVTDGGGRSSGI